jgi:hypothetical protein
MSRNAITRRTLVSSGVWKMAAKTGESSCAAAKMTALEQSTKTNAEPAARSTSWRR